nr:hypothetical protein [uncultured archaeon]
MKQLEQKNMHVLEEVVIFDEKFVNNPSITDKHCD